MNYIINLLTLNPMTSDSANFQWLIPIALVSLVLVILLTIIGKKRK